MGIAVISLMWFFSLTAAFLIGALFRGFAALD